MQHHGHRHVVGQVGRQHGRLAHFRFTHSQRVRGHHVHPVRELRRPGRDGPREFARQHRVNLHRDQPRFHVSGCLEQSERQRPQARSDLEDHVARLRRRERGDLPDRALLNHEVLPEPLGRPDAEPASDLANVPRPQQPHTHHALAIVDGPSLPLAPLALLEHAVGAIGRMTRAGAAVIETDPYQAKTREPVDWMCVHRSATSMSLSAASARIVCAVIAGEFGLPRCGTGVR